MRSRSVGNPPDGDWRDLVVLCAANRWDTTKVADQHMAEHLARSTPVLYVDPPMSSLALARDPELREAMKGPRLQRLGPNLARLTPVVQPFPERARMVQVTTTLLRWSLRRAVTRLDGSVRGVLSAWPLFPVWGACDERSRVYWAQDDFVGLAEIHGMDGDLVAARERVVARDAAHVVAANPVVGDLWRARGAPVSIIPFGCEAVAYASVDTVAPADDVALSAPVVGFVGRLNERTDLALLEAIADRGNSLLLVGSRDGAFDPGRVAALFARANVQWVGPRPFDDLPKYFAAIDVGVTPYRDSAFNRGSFPLKTLEYLAAGRPVVSTDLPAARWLDTDLVALATGPEEFADAVEAALRAPSDADIVARRRALAERNSWERRAAEMLAVIDAAGSGR